MGHEVTRETRGKIGASKRGKTIEELYGPKKAEEVKKKIRTARACQEHTEESNRKRSETLKNRIVSKETRSKLSEANTGKKHSLATIEKFKARRHTQETKEKLSELNKGKIHSVKTRKRMSASQKHRWFLKKTLSSFRQSLSDV